MSKFVVIMAKLGGRKFVMAVLTIVFGVFVLVGVDIPIEMKESIIKWVSLSSGAFIGAQGLSDGMSGGATSSVVKLAAGNK